MYLVLSRPGAWNLWRVIYRARHGNFFLVFLFVEATNEMLSLFVLRVGRDFFSLLLLSLLAAFSCWLKCAQEPWALRAHPELGFLTVIALGTEKTWLVVGTSRGFVMLWDLRFQVGELCFCC